MPRAKNGEAICPTRRSGEECRRLQELLGRAEIADDLKTWRRAKAVLGYLEGKQVIAMAEELGVSRGSINRWLQWFNARGADGLRTRKPPGRAPRLTESQCNELKEIIEAGPRAAGYDTGIWTGPMIADWLRRQYGIQYHKHYIPRLLYKLGFSAQRPRKKLAPAGEERQGHCFSAQRPRKKLAPAGEERQGHWLEERFPVAEPPPRTVV